MCLMSNLRCISFGLECCGLGDAGNRKDRPVKSHSLLDMLVYNFYFPLFPNGPVITYDAFHKMVGRFLKRHALHYRVLAFLVCCCCSKPG